ncbi:thiaminase II [Vagococcus sp. PNs007]|uniref:Aminopyrimidine aminohydrolase n=1 Tax=Vagococcus proximus TaxID=2991417 RepID=A0ABT5X1Y9_9ENTE|nr:thiaminase II [Vagococcus proximus]MDF0480005.1 thiaminase II [Vagococcus proximus]
MFTTQARALSIPYWEGSFEHPFIKELASGKLAHEKFRYYLIQDRYYLEHFSKIHFMLAEKTSDKQIKELMLSAAKHLEEGELAIRQQFFEELAITPREIEETVIAPTAYHYVSHMYRQLLTGTVQSVLAGLLPCPWLYQDIGEKLIEAGSPNGLYQRWIETYSNDEGAEEIVKQCTILNQLYETSNEVEQADMLEAFLISAKMEYAFWDMSYNLEVWRGMSND